MLKIKDNVDLKDLEKFGWEYERDEDEQYWCKYIGGKYKLFLGEKREIIQGAFFLIFGFKPVQLNEDYIQDLIQAGLVEKVGD